MNHPMMSPFWGQLTGGLVVMLMLIFIGIWIWAWRKRHHWNFKRMSELPMEDKPEAPVRGNPRTGENNSKGRQP